jgi:riboflavin kinase / FMN adenylyltransferase
VRIHTDLAALPAAARSVAIGTFDGVHAGHQKVIATAVMEARRRELRSAVLTFSGHPLSVLDAGRKPRLLTPLGTKIRLISALGPDELVVLEFDRTLAAVSSQLFCRDVLTRAIGTKLVVVGANFSYGAGGTGTADTLRACGDDLGFDVIVVPLVSGDGRTISSTLIRGLLAKGALEEVRSVLGRPPSAAGRVVHGFRRGRSLGVPTANLDVEADTIFPGRGVYAARALVDGCWYRAAVNVGENPTFHYRDEETTVVHVEAFLLGFEGDLYDHQIKLDFLHKIRDERRFDEVGDLVAQMERDIRATAELPDPEFAAVGL